MEDVRESDTSADEAHRPPIIYVVSDSLGELASSIASAAASQFSDGSSEIHRLPNANNITHIAEYVDAVLKESDGEIALFHTIANLKLRAELEDYLKDKPVMAVDLIGPSISAIAHVTGEKPRGEAGLFRKPSEEYYHRIEAMGFAVEHDDGRNVEQLKYADIVLIGASRTSKTPLSVYLATYGYKVANIPLVAEIEPPAQLFEIDHRRIFGITSTVKLLTKIRSHRLGNAIGVAATYAAQTNVQQDLDASRRLMRKLGCIVVRTDGRSIEETAREILYYYHLSFPDT